MSSCPTQIELEQHVASNELAENAEFCQHLEVCSRCKQIYEDLTVGNALLGQIGDALNAQSDNGKQGQVHCEPGDKIAGYRLLRRVYAGGQATVFEAVSEDAGEKVAVKIWNHSLDGNVEQRIRFQRELNAVQSLEHDCIVVARDAGIEQGVGYLVMEFLEGDAIDSFADALRNQNDAIIDSLCQLLVRVCDAVAFAHARGIIHRDLKPANVLVADSGSPTVLDFGLAKLISADSDQQGLTATGQFLGTLAYASPEQTIGKPQDVDAQSDVYALGVMAYRVLTGRMPYATAGPAAEVLSNIQSAVVELPSRWNLDINRDLDAILMKALARDKRERYATVNALQTDLQSFLNGDVIAARRSSRFHLLAKVVRRHALATATALTLVASLLLALVFGGIALVQTRRSLELSGQAIVQQQKMATEAKKEQADVAIRAYHASITAATLSGDPRSARQLLLDAPKVHRHWEWNYLSRLSDQTETLLTGHQKYVESVRPIGTERLMSTSWDGTARLWDLRQNTEIASRKLSQHTWALAVSPDGSIAAVGDFDGNTHIVDTNDLSTDHVIPGPYPVFGACFNADGSQLACSYSKSEQLMDRPGFGTVCFYDSSNWSKIGSVDLETSLRGVCHLEDDRWFVSGLSLSGIVSSKDGLLEQFTKATAASYDAKSSHLYLAQLDGNLVALDIAGKARDPLWTFASGAVNEMGLSADRKHLALAGRASTVRVLDVENGSLVHQREGHDWAVSTCAFIDGQRLATGGWDETVRVWNLAPAAAVFEVWHGHRDKINKIVPFVNFVLTGSKDGTVRVWNSPSGELLQTVELNDAVWSIDIDQDSGELVCGIAKGKVFVGHFNLNTGRITKRAIWAVSDEEGAVHDARIVARGRAIVCTSSNMLAEVDLETGTKLSVDTSHKGHIHRIQILPNGLAATADHDMIRIWKIGTFEKVQELRRSIFQDDYSLEQVDGMIIAGRNPGQIGIWNLESSKPEYVLNGHGDEVFDLAIHPDKSRMVSCSADNTTKIWDLTNRRLLTVIKTPDAYLSRVEFGPDGDTLYGGTRDGRLFVWNMASVSATEGEHLANQQ